jgi:hypothetical protein
MVVHVDALNALSPSWVPRAPSEHQRGSSWEVVFDPLYAPGDSQQETRAWDVSPSSTSNFFNTRAKHKFPYIQEHMP